MEAARGADVNALLPQEEWAPLHLACACGNKRAVKALLRQGANAGMQRQVRPGCVELDRQPAGLWQRSTNSPLAR